VVEVAWMIIAASRQAWHAGHLPVLSDEETVQRTLPLASIQILSDDEGRLR
jgi:hypothetical protein